MVWRKVILSFLLICCILLVAASGSPANAAEMEAFSENDVLVNGSVSDYALEYYQDYLFSNPLDLSKDYLLFQAGVNTYVLLVGSGFKDGTDYHFSSEVVYMLLSEDGINYSFLCDSIPLSYVIQNPDCFVVYSSFDSDPSVYERSDVFAFSSLVLLATCIVCYLLRSVYSFCLRRE